MELSAAIGVAKGSLAVARGPESHEIASAVEAHQVVGVLGEAEVGKTSTVQHALSVLDTPVLRVDLDGAASSEHVAFLLAKAIARNAVGTVDLSLLAGDTLVPERLRHDRATLARLLSLAGLDEALREWPSGRFSLADAITALAGAAKDRPLVLWIDHLEAPRITPRHPLDVGRLLWNLREVLQRRPELKLVATGHSSAESMSLGPKAAFHQQGQWLTLDRPAPSAWAGVAAALEVRIDTEALEQLVRLSEGHPATMLLALLELHHRSGSHPDAPAASAESVLRTLATRDDGLAARSILHARSVHRLGAQVLTQIACSQPPYGADQRGASSPQEIRKVLGHLHVAGLIRREPWTVVNPLVAMRLRGSVRSLRPAPGGASPT